MNNKVPGMDSIIPGISNSVSNHDIIEAGRKNKSRYEVNDSVIKMEYCNSNDTITSNKIIYSYEPEGLDDKKLLTMAMNKRISLYKTTKFHNFRSLLYSYIYLVCNSLFYEGDMEQLFDVTYDMKSEIDEYLTKTYKNYNVDDIINEVVTATNPKDINSLNTCKNILIFYKRLGVNTSYKLYEVNNNLNKLRGI